MDACRGAPPDALELQHLRAAAAVDERQRSVGVLAETPAFKSQRARSMRTRTFQLRVRHNIDRGAEENSRVISQACSPPPLDLLCVYLVEHTVACILVWVMNKHFHGVRVVQCSALLVQQLEVAPQGRAAACDGRDENAEDANVLDLLVPLHDRVCGLVR